MSLKQEAVLDAVRLERDAQDRSWGGPDHDKSHTTEEWVAYMTKYLGRAVNASEVGDEALRTKSLVQAAALAVAALETS